MQNLLNQQQNMPQKILLGLFGLIPFLFITSLQAELRFNSFSEEVGIEQSSVYDIFKDQQGYLWFASNTDGLLRYDGYELINWFEFAEEELGHVSYGSVLSTPKNGIWAATWGSGILHWLPETKLENLEPLASLSVFTNASKQAASASNYETKPAINNRAQKVFEDSFGRVFVGTLTGLQYAEPGQNELLVFPSDNPLSRVRIWGIAETSQYLWFATTEGLIRLSLDLQSWENYLPQPEIKGVHRLNELRTILVVGSDIWVGYSDGVMIWNTALQKFLHVSFPEQVQKQRYPLVNALRLWGDQLVLAGGDDGLYQIDRRTLTYKPTKNGSFRYLDGIDIRAIGEDNNGSIWLGTRERGIFYSQNKEENFTTLSSRVPEDIQPLLERNIDFAHYTINNDLWLGVNYGILKRDAATKEWSAWPFPESTSARRVSHIYEDSTGVVWVTLNDKFFKLDLKTDSDFQEVTLLEAFGLHNALVNYVYEYQPGKLWFGIWGQGIVELDMANKELTWVFDEFKSIGNDYVYDIGQLQGQGTWVVARYSGIFWRGKGSKTWSNIQDINQKPLPSRSFLCAHMSQSVLWLCSEQGLVSVDTKTHETSLYTKEHGLPSNRVVGIKEDSQGLLWVATSHGLAQFNKQTQNFISFGLSDGLPSLTFVRGAFAQSPDGAIFAGSSTGAVEFYPEHLSFSTRAPAIGVSKVLLDDKDLTRSLNLAESIIHLPRSHRTVAFQYSVLDSHDPTRNMGRYRLLGFNNEWSPWSHNRTLSFHRLAPGNYQLEIEGRNSLGVSSARPLRFDIQVHQPWWYASWVWMLVLAMLVSVIVLVINIRIKALEKANKRLDELVKLRTQELEHANAELKKQSQTDYLTKLPNRWGFTEHFHRLIQQYKKEGVSFALVLLDVDYFKKFNDTYGHEAGDAVLIALGQVLKNGVRKEDIPSRWGGEEFVLLLSNTSLESAAEVCEKLRAAIENLKLDFFGETLNITATFGVYQADLNHPEAMKIEHWIRCADEALYQGKAQGRNQVVVYSGE